MIHGPIAMLATEATEAGARATSLPVLVLLMLVGAFVVLAVSRFIATIHLALGFACTVSMWAVGYVSMMAPGLWIGEALFVVTLAIPVAFGAIARRAAASPVKVGLVSAFANLLVVGAFLSDEHGKWSASSYAFVVGLFGASAALSGLGGLSASRARPIALPATAGLFALVSAATVFILLVTGGLVTGLESGLAVPDWPNSFGHNMLLYPISEMKGGIYYEHAHRLFGMLVGTTALVLVSVVFREERAAWIRMLACAFLAIVCVQGLLGGLRVTGRLTTATAGVELQPSTILAIAHGMFGQIVFATACVIAVVASRTWRNALPAGGIADAGRVRAMPLVLVALLLVQLFLGASYRHLQIPPHDGQSAVHPAWPIWGHIGGALVILVLAVMTGAIVSSRAREIAPLRILGKGLVHAVGLQLALGIGALVVVLLRVDEKIPAYEVIVTSAHQALGALLLAMSAMLAAFSLRMVASSAPATAALTPSATRA
jgi:heme A synthase